MKIELLNKHALVCGGSSGIGLAIAQLFASAGATVTILSRTEKNLKSALDDLPTPNQQKHHYLALDLSDTVSVKREIDAFVAQSKPIDILINNAGGPPAGPCHLAKPESFLLAFTQHLLSPQILVQAVLPSMKKRQFGRIVNIISTSVKQPIDNLGVSNTIRGAVANWSKTLSKELGPLGITVNNVLPGATKTQRLEAIIENKASNNNTSLESVISHELSHIPVGRFAEPNEVASAVAFLASEYGAYINGINLPVDGGRTASL